MDIDQLAGGIGPQTERLRVARADIGGDIAWYPYDIFGNIAHLDAMLMGQNRDLDHFAQGLPVADIGAADGDLAFALEDIGGWEVDIIDTAATNMNGLRGARALQAYLGSKVGIYDIDLDRQFELPRERYGLVFVLGILYHLQNPYYMLRQLALRSSYCLLSTRVARFAGPERTPIADLPVAYLVAPDETNNDATNYWMFSPAGLERIVQRAGWTILARQSAGDVVASDPSTPEHDERMFLLLISTVSDGANAAASAEVSSEAKGTGSGAYQRPMAASPSEDVGAAAESSLICWPLDHYYSPIPNTHTLSREPARSRVWPSEAPATPGIDWRAHEQIALMQELGDLSEFPIPDGPTGDPSDYHAASEMFSRLDAWILQAMLRHFQPRRMIEVGCGWSSLMTARVNRELLGGTLDFTCIEPYPPEFLHNGIEGISRLIVSQVEQAPVETFLGLEAGDFLFIDTSHTVKTGGDVVFLLQDVLPRLADGVIVHIHDIFLPWDYPPEWVLGGRAWNEQYAVRAFLAFSSAFEILLGVGWMSHFRPDILAATLPDYPEKYRDGGGSLWIRRTSCSR
jgi:tRNA (mo5U34)-methyltransferase